MLTIYITRHGQDEDNAARILNGHRNQSLTEIGRKQATELAQGIKEMNLSFDAVYVSPLARTLQTAKAVTDALGLPEAEVLPELIERDFGVMTGKPLADIESLCAPDILKTEKVIYFLSPEGAETFPDLLERGRRALAEVISRHSDGTVLVVTHGDLGKMMYAAYYNLTWEQVLTGFHFGNSELLVLSPSSSATDSHIIHIEQHN